MRLIIAAVLATIVGCAAQPQVVRVDPQVQAYEAAVVEYQRKAIEKRTAEEGPVVTAQREYILQRQQMAAEAEYRARAECSMRAQEANSNNFGLIHGFFAGLGTGSACIEYYQKIGVIR